MSNVDNFLDIYSEIERHLRHVTRSGRGETFYKLVDTAARESAVVRRFRDDLKEFADLRNAVVHERRGGKPIAEPNDWAVQQFQAIASQLLQPPTVWPHFQVQVATLKLNDPIATAVTIMHENSFSQIPIYDERSFSNLLTSNTVTRWLGANVSEDLVSLSETPIHVVLDHIESDERAVFVGRNTVLAEVVELFQKTHAAGRRLEALLVTQNGKSTEQLLGIITVNDLFRVNQLLAGEAGSRSLV